MRAEGEQWGEWNEDTSSEGSDHVPLGELQSFWDAREETGAECSSLKGTTCMEGPRRQYGDKSDKKRAGETADRGARDEAKRARHGQRNNTGKRKPHEQGSEGHGQGMPKRSKCEVRGAFERMRR